MRFGQLYDKKERKTLVSLMNYFDKWLDCYKESNPVIKSGMEKLDNKDRENLLTRMKKERNYIKNLLMKFEHNLFHKEEDEIKSEYKEILHHQCLMRRLFCIRHIDYRLIEDGVIPFDRNGCELLNLTDSLSDNVETIIQRNYQMLNILYDYSPYNEKIVYRFMFRDSDMEWYKKFYKDTIRLVQMFDPDKEWYLKRMKKLRHFYQTFEKRKVKMYAHY